MTNRSNDIEELEELLTELEGQEAQLVSAYSEDDDAVTQLMDAPLGDQEWMVQVTPLDRRMMSTDQLLGEFHAGRLSDKTLVWRSGMADWLPLQRVDELAKAPRPPGPLPRLSLGNLPPPPAARPASQPMWSAPGTSPMSAPSSPPIGAMAASAMPAPSAAPIATAPSMASPPPTSAQPASEPISQTTRPVALDFSDVPPETVSPLQNKRALIALGGIGIMAVFVTFYALSSGGAKTGDGEAVAAANPQTMAALQPAPSPAATAAPSSAPEPTPEPAAPASEAKETGESGEQEAAEEESASDDTRATAQARYTPRSEYRRRPRSSRSQRRSAPEKEPAETAAAATPPRSTAAEEDRSEPETAADDDADSTEPPRSTGRSNTFNREAAKAALAEAATQARNCQPPGGPSGTGRVQVRYEPSGKVSSVTILTSKFENTTTGSCVRMLFRRAKVPEFTGVPVVVVNKSFEIP